MSALRTRPASNDESTRQRSLACRSKTTGTGSCTKYAQDDQTKTLQRRTMSDRMVGAFDVLPYVRQPLDAVTTQRLEPTFGVDFSRTPAYANKDLETTTTHQDLTFGTGGGYIQPPAPPPSSGKCELGRSESKCEPWTGTYAISKIANTCCTKPCTIEHEELHVREGNACCQAVSRALTKEGGKQTPKFEPIYAKFKQWHETFRPISECHAWMHDLACGQRLATEYGCDNRRDASSSSQVASRNGLSDKAAIEGTQSLATTQKFPDNQLVDEKAWPSARSSTIKERADCCLDIEYYIAAAEMESAAYCNLARGQLIPPCPFV